MPAGMCSAQQRMEEEEEEEEGGTSAAGAIPMDQGQGLCELGARHLHS